MDSFLIISIVLAVPALGGLLTYLSNRSYIAIASIAIAFLCSVGLVFLAQKPIYTFEWLPGYFLTIQADGVSSLFICLVLFISLLVHMFSAAYMKGDEGANRYFAKLGFFTFSMIGLLIADHLLLLFVFWELVGFASYLLIGFWYKKEGVPHSARLSFMINRIADVALLIGILLLHAEGSLSISEMNKSIAFLPSILLAIGAFGKSAQLPFSGWLTNAMVGPTPVSALIHAATMVAAGVYLLFRIAPFLAPEALTIIAIIGSITAFYGAVSALFQNDIKKVLAYSTISQLGYMVIGIGVGAEDASFFHLFTHAFFKAGLFLGAGSIIHYMHQNTSKDAQDMRFMGGLKNELPWTFRSFMVCGLALAGVPLFTGFMSKEGIIIGGWQWAESIGTWGYLIPDLALITALITALYVGRMLMLVFYGEHRIEETINDFKESSLIKVPLIVLALGSLWFIFNINPLAHHSWIDGFLSKDLLSSPQMIGQIVMLLSLIMTAAGLMLAYAFFKPGSVYSRNFLNMQPRFRSAENGFYLVNAYQALASSIYAIAAFLHKVDKKVVDKVIHFIGIGTVVLSKVVSLIDRFLVDGPVNLTGYLSSFIGKRLAGLSSRDLQTQFSWLIVFVILILSWILFF